MQNESEIVIELAKSFIDAMDSYDTTWEKAFLRFNIDENQCGSGGSYFANGNIKLISSIKASSFIRHICDEFTALHKALKKHGKEFCVALLVIDSDFNFKILYEYNDKEKWSISKIDSDGIPNSYDINSPMSTTLPETKRLTETPSAPS